MALFCILFEGSGEAALCCPKNRVGSGTSARSQPCLLLPAHLSLPSLALEHPTLAAFLLFPCPPSTHIFVLAELSDPPLCCHGVWRHLQRLVHLLVPVWPTQRHTKMCFMTCLQPFQETSFTLRCIYSSFSKFSLLPTILHPFAKGSDVA